MQLIPRVLPGEEWRAVEGFPGYTVSSLGRVRGRRGRVLIPSIDSWGYPRVMLRRDGKTYSRGIHRLVCSAFHPETWFKGALALHRNDIQGECTKDNLYWGTHMDNGADRRRNGTSRVE